MKVLPISKVKAKLSRILSTLEQKGGAITGWQETVEILEDSELMKEIRDGIKTLRRTKKRYILDKLFAD